MLAEFPYRPLKSQIVGVVKFGEAVRYCSKHDFDAAVHDHCIPAGHSHDWNENALSRVGWRIETVCRLLVPEAFIGVTKWGFLGCKTFQVQFGTEVGVLFLRYESPKRH